jgi:hypothetical protein
MAEVDQLVEAILREGRGSLLRCVEGRVQGTGRRTGREAGRRRWWRRRDEGGAREGRADEARSEARTQAGTAQAREACGWEVLARLRIIEALRFVRIADARRDRPE